MSDDDQTQIAHSLQQDFELTLADRIDRHRRTRVHTAIPSDFFSVASSECRDMFVGGHFYGCILLAQAVAEGLAKFLAVKNGILPCKDHRALVNALQKDGSNPVISSQAYAAFRLIRGRSKEDRDTYHHLNQDVEHGHDELEARAETCLNALYEIESEVFAFTVGPMGTVILKHPRYWPSTAPGEVMVYVRPN